MERLDKVLVTLGLASTRSQAKLLIEEGVVYFDGKLMEKTSAQVPEDLARFEIRKEKQYASRGAHKIEGALSAFSIDCGDLVVADVGASTGGFTDFVLGLGAKKVYAIDVGHDQLAKHLREDPRVINLEGTNIRYPLSLAEQVDLAVVDLSFISLRLTLPTIFSLVKDEGMIVALVKPQFEAGVERIGKNGIVKEEWHPIILRELFSWCEEQGFIVQAACLSPICGKSGNREFFFYFKKGFKTTSLTLSDLETI